MTALKIVPFVATLTAGGERPQDMSVTGAKARG